MKIVIIGAGATGLALATQVAERAVRLGVEAEARQATPAEEQSRYLVAPAISEQQFIIEPMPRHYLVSGLRHISKEEVERTRRKAYDYAL